MLVTDNVDEDEEAEELEDDDDEYEYTYADDDADGDDDDAVVATSTLRGRGPTVVFTGLDTIGNTNDMVLKKELTRIQPDIEKTKNWRVDLTWAEESRMLGVVLEHEGFSKAHLNLTFPHAYPGEPPKFQWLGPRFDDTVDFVLAADVFEPCRKENWNDTFTCTNLLMIVMEVSQDSRTDAQSHARIATHSICLYRTWPTRRAAAA
jgi:ubiquitin-protein ligase